MKAKLKEKLSEIPNDFLLEILDNLCEKNQHLEKEIEFILNPTKIKYAQSYYNRLVKTAIDTNSWSHFPNKGIIGLRTCVSKMQLLQSVGNDQEARKLALAITGVIDRCNRNYNYNNQDQLDEIGDSVDIY